MHTLYFYKVLNTVRFQILIFSYLDKLAETFVTKDIDVLQLKEDQHKPQATTSGCFTEKFKLI